MLGEARSADVGRWKTCAPLGSAEKGGGADGGAAMDGMRRMFVVTGRMRWMVVKGVEEQLKCHRFVFSRRLRRVFHRPRVSRPTCPVAC